jgi:hypothetical protein
MHTRRLSHQPLLWTIVGVLGLGLAIAGLMFLLRPQPPLPETLMKQVNFLVLYPAPAQKYVLAPDKASYDQQAKVLIFHATKPGIDLTISQQATPEQFTDIPEYFPKLVEKLNSYSGFDSLNGKVYLTRPTELKGQQSAVFNGKGTLMFVQPSRDLANDEWREFFNALILYN